MCFHNAIITVAQPFLAVCVEAAHSLQATIRYVSGCVRVYIGLQDGPSHDARSHSQHGER
jgi:hypothetical protein